MKSLSCVVLVFSTLLSFGCQPETASDPAAPPAPAAEEAAGRAPANIGTRVFVVQREAGSLAVYDFAAREMVPAQIEGLGNLRHATMTFSPDLRYGYLATRNGQLTRIDLHTLETAGTVFTSENSIDIAISQDGRFIATAEYLPGGVTILDAQTMEVVHRLDGSFEENGQTRNSRMTGIVDAPGNRFVAVGIESAQIVVIDASDPEFPVEHRIDAVAPEPYDAMITPDGRYYLVGHIENDAVSLVDLLHPELGARPVALFDPTVEVDAEAPVKLPHMASWAFAQGRIFVPLVGEARLAVINPQTWQLEESIPLLGNPVYAVRAPTEREIWVSFSGEEHDAFVQIIDVESRAVVDTIEVGGRIYHMDFTPRGGYVLVSANRDNTLALINAETREIEDRQTIESPSGIFGVWRAFRIGL